MSDVSSDEMRGFPSRGPSVAWGPVAALVVSILAFIGAQVLAGVVLAEVSKGYNVPHSWFTTTAGQFYFVLLTDVFVFLTIWLFLRSRGAKLQQLGFGRSPVWKDLGLALLGYLIYFLVFIALSILASVLTQIDLNQKQELGFDYLFSSSDKIMALVSLVVLPPIIEETVFRGFLFTGLRKKFKFVWATLITSAIFASLHLLGSSEGLLWVAGLDTLVLSFVLCYLREKTGALWAPMAVHAIKNLIAFAILLSSVAAL